MRVRVRGRVRGRVRVRIRITVGAVAPRLLEQRHEGALVVERLAPRARVPGVVRKQHAHARRVQLRRHLLHAVEPAGHRTEEVELVAVVDADVRVGGPEEDRIDAAVAPLEVREEALDSVVAAHFIKEEAIVRVDL